MAMQVYTVELLYPDYLSGGEIQAYSISVEAHHPDIAARMAKLAAAYESNNMERDPRGDDFRCFSVTEGKHDILYSEL
jgi:hypothetical protein